MRVFLRIFLLTTVLLALVLGAFSLDQWWVQHPFRPKELPKAAIWIPAPPAPLDFSPRGDWLACWIDQDRNVDHCKLTNYKGKQEFDADYSPTIGSNPVPENHLYLKSMESEDLWAVVGQVLVPIARLRDGTIMVPTQYLPELRTRYAH
jgi:hypothetical protein